MSSEQLQTLLEAPDLTKRERRELKRAVRFQRRVETWEARRAAPAPKGRIHRPIITLLLMAATLFVLYLLLSGPPS